MKNPKFFLTTLFAAAAMTATAHAAGDTILINFDSQANGTGDASWGIWNETTGSTGADVSLVDSSGETAGAKLTYWSANTYSNGSASGILKGYLDDGGNGVSISVSTSYLVADVTVYFSTDTSGRQYLPAQINGNWYTYSNEQGATILGKDNWGETAGNVIEEGVSTLVVSGLSGDVSVHTTTNGVWWGPRGGIAALKVVNTYAGTVYTGTISGNTDWAGCFTSKAWTNSQSTVSDTGLITTSGGAYADLTLTANAILTLKQDVITDAVYLSGDGKTLTLDKGTGSLTFSGPAVLKVGNGATLEVKSSDVALAENVAQLTLSGDGKIRFTDAAAVALVGSDFIKAEADTQLAFAQSVDVGTGEYTVSKGTQIFEGGITAGTVNVASEARFGVAAGTSLSVGNNDASSVKQLNLGSGGLFVGGELTIDVPTNVVVSGKLSGDGKIVVTNSAANGTGLYINNNTNNFTGTFVVSGGAIVEMGPNNGYSPGSNSRLSESGTDIIVEDGGTFRLHIGNNSFSGNFYLKNGAALGNRDGNANLTGNIHFGVDDAYDGTQNALSYNENAVVSYTQNWRKDINLSGVLSGVGTVELNAQSWEGGTATYTISNDNNTFSGTYKLVANSYSVTLNLPATNAVKYATIDLSTANTKVQVQADVVVGGLKGVSGTTIASGAYTFTVNGGGDFAGDIAPGKAAIHLVKDGASDSVLTLTGTGNNYSGGTEVKGGKLVAGHATALGSGSIAISGGTLSLAGGISNFGYNISMTGGAFDVSLMDVVSVSSLSASSGSTLSLGMLSTDTAALTTTGALTLDKGTIFDLSPALGGAEKITYILAEGATLDGITATDVNTMNRNNLLFGGLAATERVGAVFVLDGNVLKLELAKPVFTDLTWIGGNGATWKYQGDTLWSSQIATETGATPKFENGDTVIFNTAGAGVAVEGAVQPGGIVVNENVTFTAVADSGASLALAAGTALTVADGKTATIDASLGTTGLLKKAGTGTLELSGAAASLFSSAQITEGRVNLLSAESLKSAIMAEISEGATLGFSVSADQSVVLPTGMISGAGTLEKLGSGTLNVSGGTNAFGTLKISGGTANFSGGATSTTNGTIVENAELVISAGGASSVLRGNLTINDGGVVRLTGGDATGWGGGANAINALVINEGGEMVIETVSHGGDNQTFNMSGGITLKGGKISGKELYSKFDLHGNTMGVTTVASDTTAEIASAVALREHGTFSVEDGGAEIDLLVSGIVTNYGQVISGSKYTAKFEKTGTGTMKLSGDNSYWYAGGSVKEGKLIAASATALGTGALAVESGATLEFATGSGNFANALSGSGEIVVNSTGTITLSGENTLDGNISVSAGKLVAGSASALGTGTVSVASGATLGRGDVSVSMEALTLADGATLAFGSVFTGTAYSVAGTADLSSDIKFDFVANFSSGTYELISAGTLNLDTSALSESNLSFGGETSSRASAVFSVEDNKLVLDLVKKVYTDLIWQDSADAKWENRGSTLWASQAAGGTTTFENGDSVTFATADANVTVAGDIIVGNITATENATLSTGTTETSALTIDGKVTVDEGKTLTFDKTIATSGALTKEGAGTFVVAADAAGVFDSVNIAEGAFGLSVADGTATFAGAVSGVGRLEKLGAGTLELSSAQNYSGGTLVSDGTLKITNKNALGSGLITVGSGAVLDLAVNMDGSTNKYILAGGMLSASVETGSGNAQIASGAGTIVLTADSSVGGTANFGMISSGYAANTLELGGNTLTKTGSNTFFLASTTITSGTIEVEEGVIQVVNTLKADGDVTFNIADSANLGFNGKNFEILENANVTIAGTFNSPATITVNKGAVLDLTQASRKENGGGSGSLVIAGGTVKMAKMNRGAGSNFGANFDSDRITLRNGGVLDVTAAQASGSESAGLTVNEGTYRYSGTGTSYVNAGGGAFNVSKTLTLDVVDKDAVLNIAKTISAIGSVKITGSGTVLLSGNNNYTGGTTLENGTLALGNATAAGAGTITLAGGTLTKADGVSEALTITNNISVAGVVAVKNLSFGGVEDGEGNVSGGVWYFTESVDTSFSGVALTDVSFSKTTIDVSGVDFDDDNLTMTLFTNYAGAAEDFIVSGGAGAGTISVDASKNVIFTAGENFLTLVWDPSAAETVNDKVWSASLFNGKDYSAAPTLRKYKFMATAADATEAATIKGEVNAKRLNVLGNYTFSGLADDAGTAAKLVFAESSDDAGTLSGMGEVSVVKDATIAFDKTVATSGSIVKKGEGKLVVAADASEVLQTVQIQEGAFGLSVADGATATYAGTVYDYGEGTFEKLGAGTLVLSGSKEWFEGTLLISEGTLKLGTRQALGASSVSVVIGENGTLDLNGQTVDRDYGNYVLAGGALINTGAEIGGGSKQLAGGISLTADSSVGGTSNFGMVSNGWGSNKLDLAGHILTKTDSNSFILANTTITSGGIRVEGGALLFHRSTVKIDGDVSFETSNDGVLDFAGVGMTLNSGASATIAGTFHNPATITVNKGATLDLTQASRKEESNGNGSLVISGGTVKIANSGYGEGTNWGAKYDSNSLSISDGGVLEVTQAQVGDGEPTGRNRGFNVTSGSGTYRFSGTGTNYLSEAGESYQVNVAGNSELIFDVVNADAGLEVAKIIKGNGSVKLDSAGTVTLSGANTYAGGTTVARGTLKVGGDSALGTGTVSVAKDGVLETGATESTVINNTIAGTGTVNVKGDTTLGGSNTFDGKYAVTDKATLTVAGKLGSDSVVAEIAGGSALKYAPAANTTASGIVKLEKDASLINASADDVITTLATTVSGDGNIRQVAGTMNIASASLGEFNGTFVLEGGTLAGLNLDDSTASVSANLVGGTVKNWTLDKATGTVAVTAADSVALEGAFVLKAGTLSFESLHEAAYFTGTASVEISDGFIFNFQNLSLQDTDDPNTKTASVQVFDSGLTLIGWDKVGFEDIRISGKEIDAHYNIDIGNSGDVTITLTSQTIIWNAGSTGTWDNQKMNWELSDGAGIAFADYDTVRFENNAEVEISGNLIPAEIVVADNVDLTLKGFGSVLGGTTTVGNGASFELSVVAGAVPTFKNKVSGTGTFVLNNTIDASFSATLNGANTLSGSVGFEKLGAGTLAADASQNAYSGAVSLKEGKILVSETNALGTGTLSLSGGTLEVAAAKETSVVVNNVITGSTPDNAALTLSGEGTVTLTQANTYTGKTAVSGNAIAQNAKAFGESSVEVSGSVTLDSADAGFENDFSGNGRLSLAKSATLSGDVSELTGTLAVDSGATLKANSASNFAGTLELSGLATFEKVGSGKFTISETIKGDSKSAITVSDGTLAVGGANAQSFAGTLTVNASKAFEKIGANTLTLSGALAGTGSISVKEGVLSFGGLKDQSFAGTVSLEAGTTLEKVRSNTLTLSGKLSGVGSLKVAGGILELSTADDYALEATVSGAGTLKKSDIGKLTLATGTNVANIDLAGGTLGNVEIGNNAVALLKVSATGTTLDALTANGGTLDVSAAAVTLAGATELSGGTIVLGGKDAASLIVTGTTTITKSDALVFNLSDFTADDYPTHTSPNTLGETATVVYKVFDVNTGATLDGWTALDKGNFTIGSGAALSDRASLELGTNGSLSLTNEIYSLTWNASEGTWATGDGKSWKNNDSSKATDTAYMNSDRVTFASDATVSLGSNVAPTSLSVNDGADLTIVASDSYKITGAGTVTVGKDASLILNSAHDYTGATTLADGATVRLNLSANDASQFASDLVLAENATGTLLVDTQKFGATGFADLDTVFTGKVGDGVWSFEKLGEGILTVASKMSAFTSEDSVNIAAGTLKLMSVDAIGSAKTTIAEGAVLEVASSKDITFMLAFSGLGDFRKSGGGTLTLANSNAMFGGNALVAEGTLKLADAGALGDSRKSTTLEVIRNAQLDLAFGGSFGKELKGEGTVNYALADRLILTADSDEFVGTFSLKADNAVATARQATSFGNGTIAFEGENGKLAFELTPASGQTVADVFSGSFEGTGTISVETGLGIAMTLSGSSADFEGCFDLKSGSTLVAEKGDAVGNEKASLILGKDAEIRVGSAENSSITALISGEGAFTKVGEGRLEISNPSNDFAGMVTVKSGVLRAVSLASLGKSAQVLLDSEDAVLELKTVAGKTETLNKVIRGSGSLSAIGGGVLNWQSAEKRFGGILSVSDKTTLNTSDFFKVESGSVVLNNGGVWNANGGLSVEGNSVISLFAAQDMALAYGMQSRASQTLDAGTQLRVGGFVAAANKSGSVVLEDISITPTDGGNGALICFDVESVKDAETPRISLTNDASVSLDNVAVEVTLDESIRSAWEVPEIEFVYRDGSAADISGDVESVTVIMADGTEVKYVYDSRVGHLSLSPVSPDMNLAYAAMVAMPTEVFNQDVQSLHRRMEQRRFETLSNKDEWQFFAQAQSMSVENGSDRSDSAVFDFSTYGTLVGGDVRLSESTVFGMALAYDRGTADIHDNQGEISMDSYRATIYAGTVFNNYYFAEGGAHFGFASYEVERCGDYGNNKGDTDGWSAGLFANAGGVIPTSVENLYLTPYVGLSYLHTAVEKIEETGTRSMATDSFNADSLRARIGIGSSYSFAIGEMPTRFGLDLAYSHEFLDDEVDADVGATGVAYSRTITEKALPEDAVSVGASFDFTLSENTGLFLNYTVDLGMNSDISHRGNVGFRFTY